MRTRLIRLLKWLLAKLDPPVSGGWVMIPVPADDLLDRARVLTQAQESYAGRSGEAKRHQVYAQLWKEFPERSKRQMARTIEAALPF